MDYDWISDALMNQMYEQEEWGETVMCDGYEDYPYVFNGGFVVERDTPYWTYYDFNFNYGHGADGAYQHKPQSLMNALMAEVL